MDKLDELIQSIKNPETREIGLQEMQNLIKNHSQSELDDIFESAFDSENSFVKFLFLYNHQVLRECLWDQWQEVLFPMT